MTLFFYLAMNMDGLICYVLDCFCEVSGLKLNKIKCSLMGINLEEGKLERLANLWGCRVGLWPVKYLGLPIGENPRAETFWNPVIEKVEKILQRWKSTFLSRECRLTLIQSVLGSFPTYFLSLFKIPKGVASKLERLIQNFF